MEMWNDIHMTLAIVFYILSYRDSVRNNLISFQSRKLAISQYFSILFFYYYFYRQTRAIYRIFV